LIRPLRRAHGAAWLALALALPLAYGLALASRPSRVLPAPAVPSAWSALTPVGGGGEPIPLAPTALALSMAGPGAFRVVATGDASSLPPGLLLYAAADSAAGDDALPEGAVLLGATRPGEEYRAPPGATSILLYAAIDGTVVGAARIPEAPP
jgi:hypothetical protein